MIGIDTALNFASTVVNKIWGDKMSDQEKAQATMALQTMVHERESKLIDAQREIIVAEAKGESWLQRNWRPILMLTIVAIVANNYLLFPYLSLFTTKTVILQLPDKLWSLMQIGVGGYVIGRSAEHVTEKWATTKK